MEPLLEGLEKTSYREGDTRVKVFGHGYLKSDILNEALNQARVEETGLRIPKLLEVRKADGKWAIVTEFVEGETLQSMMEQHPDKMHNYTGTVRAAAKGDPEQAFAAADEAERQDEPENQPVRTGRDHPL